MTTFLDLSFFVFSLAKVVYKGKRIFQDWKIIAIPTPVCIIMSSIWAIYTIELDDVFPPDDLGSRPEALC